MNKYDFEWDDEKNTINIKKHKIGFREARTVFNDIHCVYMKDEEHSYYGEDRFYALGYSMNLRLLLVCYCLRMEGRKIRIFSARKATRSEEQIYENGGVV